MKKKPGTLIPLQDYLRVHRVVRSALDMAGAETAHACWFFSVAGGVRRLRRGFHEPYLSGNL